MKIFVELKKLFKMLGIEQNQKYLFNSKNVLALSIITYYFCASIAYLIIANKSFVDIGIAFFGTSSMLVNAFTLFSIIMQQKQIFNLIGKLEEVMENGEYKML